MVFKKRNYRRRPVRKTKGRKSYARPKRSIKSIKSLVRKEIARNVENKSIQYVLSDKPLYPTNSALFNDNVIPMGINSTTLPLSQSVSAGGRIGNLVKTKKLMFKGILTPTEWNTTTNQNPRPLIVKMVFMYDREDPNDAFTISGSTIFQNGSSTTGFSNTLVDTLRPFNTDRYRIFTTRTFKLGNSAYTGTATSGTNPQYNQYYQNNDFKLACNFSVDLTKYYIKKVKFNDNLSYPMTRGLYCMCYYLDSQGQALPATAIMCELSYMLTYEFEDA